MAEPVTLATARAQCGIDEGDGTFDMILTGYIAAAREYVEGATGHVLVQREISEVTNGFPCRHIELNWRPVVAVDGIDYVDNDGVEQVFSDFRAILGRYPLRIYAAPGATWPVALDDSAVTVTYTAGYEAGSEPPGMIQAILLLVAHWFANREAGVVGSASSELVLAVQALCGQRRPVFG